MVLDGPIGKKMLDSLSEVAIRLDLAGGAFRNIANGKCHLPSTKI